MLTWAIAWVSVKLGGYNGIWFIAAIMGDVSIAYAVAGVFTGHPL
jgi:hypothetical protein